MIKQAFATPISIEKITVDEIVETIFLEYDLSKPPDDKYNIFEGDCKPAIKELEKIAYDRFRNYVDKAYGIDTDRYSSAMKAWITGHGEQYSMAIHNHSGSWFSAVYYALAEEQGRGGAISFHDPRTNANRGYDSNFAPHFAAEKIQPETGDLVIFPSFLYHHVDPYFSKFRIAIPIDLYLADWPDGEDNERVFE